MCKTIRWAIVLFIAWAWISIAGASGQKPQHQESIAAQLQGFDGCFMLREISDEKITGPDLVYGGHRCREALAPCSTFKVPNSLIGLETGEISGAEHGMSWDGQVRSIKSWNRDHTLRSAFAHSTVWYYQRLASQVGSRRMEFFLEKLKYGNMRMGDKLDSFWLGGPLLISAEQQLDFMAGLYRNDLPFAPKHMVLVRSFMDHAWRDGKRFGGKTGTCQTGGKSTTGWFVGQLQSEGKQYVFVTLIRGADGARGHVARRISRKILSRLKI